MRLDRETQLLVDDSIKSLGALNGAPPVEWGDEFQGHTLSSGYSRIEEIPSIQSWAAQRVEYAVDGLIPKCALSMITGKPSVGKSMVGTALTACCAKRMPFLGRKTERLKVLILDRENPVGVVAERFELFGMPTSDVYAWGSWLPDEPPMPDAPIVMDFARRNPSIVMIDTLIRFHGGEESSASDTAAFMARCRRLASTGAAVVLLHHVGKGPTSSDYRGSSDIAGAIDTAYALEANEGSRGLDSLKLRCFKFRVGEAPDPINFKLQDGEFVVTSDPSADRYREAMGRVCAAVAANPGASKFKIVSALREAGIGRNEAEKLIRNAVHSGEVIQHEGERGASTFSIPGALELTI